MHQRRRIPALLLLAVYLPMLLLSSVHTHRHTHSEAETLIENCADCLQHHCNGHVSETDVRQHDCVLCKFLTCSYLSAKNNNSVNVATGDLTITNHYDSIYTPNTLGVISLRAPPFC
ncbi:MAG: hypothetical protein J6Y82_07725 [Bacteroidales bacterium]|nr:hypothetical protein [Bacteroidales bacterium]